LAFSGRPHAHEFEHVLGRNVASLAPSSIVGTGRGRTVLRTRSGHCALQRCTHCGHKGRPLGIASHNDPVRAAPEQKCAAPSRATGKIIQAFEANDDMTSAAQHE
jgi:hypothetical protein